MTRVGFRHWQNWSLGAKSVAIFSVPIALLLMSMVFSYRLQQQVALANADVRRGLAIQAEIETLHSLIAESATGVRGYLLTGQDEFLVPYLKAREELPYTLTSLRRGIRDTEMTRRLDRIHDLLQRKLDTLEYLHRQGRKLPPQDLQVHLFSGKRLLDELRTEIREMALRESALVDRYSDQAGTALKNALWVSGLSGLLVLLSGLMALVLLFSRVLRRIQRIASNAERLVSGESLETMQTGSDELGQLAERLQNASLLLATRAAEARAANDAKTQFLSRTSHELRTPLNAILGFAQMLEMDLPDSRNVVHVRQILSAGRHLLQLIDEVLDIARIESRDLRLTLTPQALQPAVTDICNLIMPLAAQRDIAIEIGAEVDGFVVLADAQRLRQILLNLVSNAVKYNRHGGRVRISASLDATGRCALMIEDNGNGIPSENLARLFTPFDRLGADRGPVEGTGLGLAVSRHLAIGMQGDLQARSEHGIGSCFTLLLQSTTLSAEDVLPPSESAHDPSSRPVAAVRRNLLLIEDNASNIALIEAVMTRRPEWHLQIERNATEGLARAQAEKPALILLDLNLPDRSGEDVLVCLRADPLLQKTPIVIISADAQAATQERLSAAGATHYLTKPFGISHLLAILDQKPHD